MNRRGFIGFFSLISLTALLSKTGKAANNTPAAATSSSADMQHQLTMQNYAELTGGTKAIIGMVVYPGMFLQDLIGPLTVFESLMHREIHLLWKDLNPIKQDSLGHPTLIPITPTTTFEHCPEHLDVLFVPGGVPGTFDMMEDPVVLKFLAEKGKTARFVTSVCTGSLILGAAGLLDGYQATSHWSTWQVLKELGAIPTKGRIVTDRNRITGGGVTAGIDFGLKIAALLTNERYAQTIQLYLEYDPQPPFDAGSPEKAPRQALQFLNDMFAGMVQTATAAAQRAKARLRQ